MRVPLSWLKEFTDCRKQGPSEIGLLLTMGGVEVEAIEQIGDDTVLALGLTPNRSDCLSVYGVAREVVAICKGRLKKMVPRAPEGAGVISHHLHVDVHDEGRCPRYAARRIEGVCVGPSPEWVQSRLEAVGLRPINNVVDATNYVMWEIGQPLHAFDARHIHGEKIVIRTAGTTRSFTTLDDVARRLLPDDLLICDAERPVALAGIMGGANTEVHEGTTDVILESAYFAPIGVRRTSKRLGLMTESSRRFERGVDPNRVVTALQRVTEFICAWAGGVPTQDWIDIYAEPLACREIVYPLAEARRLLGLAIPTKDVKSILKRIGCDIIGSGAKITVRVPTFRPDVERPVDLVEEIARVHGYDRFEPRLPEMTPAALVRPEGWALRDVVLERLRALGFTEIVQYAFEPAVRGKHFAVPGIDPVPVVNPLGQESTTLKTTLISGLVEAARHNLRNGRETVRLCELRPIFRLGKDGRPTERMRLSGLMMGGRHPFSWTQGQDVVDFFDIKGLVEGLFGWIHVTARQWSTEGLPSFLHPGRAAWIADHDGRLGLCGELHPTVVREAGLTAPPLVFELDWDYMVRRYGAHVVHFRPLARHPGIRRDVALLVDQAVPAQAVLASIRGCDQEWITDVTLFDLYEGDKVAPGKKSLACAVQYQHPSRTLTDDEVNAAHDAVVAEIIAALGAEIRQ